jgi:transcriptional regulator with XRE-family HTH domain
MIGEIFKQVRKKKKLKQKDISISLGVTVNMVYRIQNSTNLVVKYSEKLSEIYGFNVLYLIPFASKAKSEKEVIIDSQIYKLIYD